MAEKIPKKPAARPGTNNKSNAFRSILFMLILLCFGAFVISNMNYGNVEKEEVPISDVIKRANDPNGNIAKIAVKGNNLEITLKGKDQPTETSRKDPSGTLYDQGLVNYCEGKEGEETFQSLVFRLQDTIV